MYFCAGVLLNICLFVRSIVHSFIRSAGAFNRQERLKKMGVQKLLQQLLSTQDATLFEKYAC